MYAFLFGKNPHIAKIEVLQYLQTRDITFSLLEDEEDYIVIGTNQIIHAHDSMPDLGGTVRIAVGQHYETIWDFHPGHINLQFRGKMNYSLYAPTLPDEEIDFLEVGLKEFFKVERVKGMYKKSRKRLVPPSQYASWNFDEGVEYMVLPQGAGYFMGASLAAPDPDEYKRLDETRPERKFTHGTSFRLARMMVNIAGLQEGQTLVDPFCGTGTFLMEGIRRGLNGVGIDADPELVEMARKNCAWAQDRYQTETSVSVEHNTAQDAIVEADAIVFEPYMGPFLKKEPTKQDAAVILDELVQLYAAVFQNLAKQVHNGTRLVCILPDIPVHHKSSLMMPKSVFSPAGWSFIDTQNAFGTEVILPIPYVTPGGSRIERRLYLLQKQ